jgi:hypothetical protein
MASNAPSRSVPAVAPPLTPQPVAAPVVTPVHTTPLTAEEEAHFQAIAAHLAALPPGFAATTTASVASGADGDATASASAKPPAHVLPLRRYLEGSILPLLTRALEALAVAKPHDPLEFLAAYLLSNNPVRQSPLPVPPCAALSGWLSAAAGTRPPALADEGSI